MSAPIIFIGMHRSGTSMVGRLISRLGLFSGAIKDENDESRFFQKINGWLISQSGGRWDNPRAFSYVLRHEDLLSVIDDYVNNLMGSFRSIEYLGVSKFLAGERIRSMSVPWGWKDPCNTFTLGYWARLFPECKVVYIERHGLDVAHSLLVRGREGLLREKYRYERFRRLIPVRPKRRGFVESPRCMEIEEGLRLWSEYLEEASNNLSAFEESRVFRIRYEGFVSNPKKTLSALSNFCGLVASDKEIGDVCSSVNPGRAYSYKRHEWLCSIAQDNEALLKKYGYEA